MDDQTIKRAPRTGGRRSPEETRQAILRAGKKEFSDQGYSGARIDKIARIANCNVRMIYHYFSSKQKLYIAVLEDAYADLRTQEGQLQIDIEKPIDGLLKLLRFTFDYFEKNPTFEGILRAENVMHGRFVRRSARVVEMGFPLRKTIADLIASGERQGVLRADLDPVHLYVTIAALSRFHLSSAFSLSAVMATDMTRAEWRKARWNHVAAVFRAYLLPPGADAAEPEAAPQKAPVVRAPRKPRAPKAPAVADAAAHSG
jgi:AcrR family transcriptional regulator